MSCIYIDNKIQKFQKDFNNNTTKDSIKNGRRYNIFDFNDFNEANGFGLDENTNNKSNFKWEFNWR